jgi:hypothetical protein
VARTDVITDRRSCVRRVKRHRYVSTCGPIAKSRGKIIAQAIAAAENEGWPIVKTHHASLVTRSTASSGSTLPRR